MSGATRSGYSAITLSSCKNCKIENNKLLSNARGIYILSSSNNTISKNIATSNTEYGIVLASALKNTVSGNSAYSNARGLYVGSSDDNIFTGNTVKDNSVVGFFICGKSDRNRIYNNYFNDVNETLKNGVGNTYNIPKRSGTNIIGGPYLGGNFWGSPDGKGFSQTATDADKDGISDAAYKNISGSIYSDNLPLTSNTGSAPGMTADFSGTPTSGKTPLNVTFTDKTTGSPTSWKWDFGDGTSGTEKNPKHAYTAAGTYTVTLTANNGASSNIATKTNYITVTAGTPAPVAGFSSNVTSGTSPLTVAFTDTSTNSPTSWNWSFGDGTSSTEKNPKHTYSAAGSYTVALTASNTGGSNTATKASYITATAGGTTLQKPVARFWGSRTSGTAPLTITFTDNSTNSPTSWKWDFGDGTSSTLQKPRHTYSTKGTYSVTFTATNAAGSGTLTRYNYIKIT